MGMAIAKISEHDMRVSDQVIGDGSSSLVTSLAVHDKYPSVKVLAVSS